MKFPNKIFSIEESVISFFSIILEVMEKQREKSIFDLYRETINLFPSNTDWVDTITCLYAMGAINFNEEKGVLTYAL